MIDLIGYQPSYSVISAPPTGGSGVAPVTSQEEPDEPFLWTASGKKFHFLNPREDEICIEDIAHALSRICRFGGHTSRFYSVGEHSIYVSFFAGIMEYDRSPIGMRIKRQHALSGLLHDASEAYLGDMISPIKHGTGTGRCYAGLERTVQNAIANKYGVTPLTPIAVVKADRMLCDLEMEALIHGKMESIVSFSLSEGTDIRDAFLRRFYALTRAILLDNQARKGIKGGSNA